MATYRELVATKVTTRHAAALTGVSRATASRNAKLQMSHPVSRATAVPANKLSLAERTRVLEVLDSAEFVDQPPLQVYARLLERGQYLARYRDSTVNQTVSIRCQVGTPHAVARDGDPSTDRSWSIAFRPP